jgi:AraC-like DNA-binding protein
MKLYIKNMVCNRCKTAVISEFIKLGFHLLHADLGIIEIAEKDLGNKKKELNKNLALLGFEILDDKKSQTIERIKNLIVDLVHYKDNEIDINLSAYLSQQLLQDYNTLSNLFSEMENTTIEKYFIQQKIEKVKELLMYDELTLSEIAYKLNYSSVAYLSNQFKKITGHSPRFYKNLKEKKRSHLDKL